MSKPARAGKTSPLSRPKSSLLPETMSLKDLA